MNHRGQCNTGSFTPNIWTPSRLAGLASTRSVLDHGNTIDVAGEKDIFKEFKEHNIPLLVWHWDYSMVWHWIVPAKYSVGARVNGISLVRDVGWHTKDMQKMPYPRITITKYWRRWEMSHENLKYIRTITIT